MSGYCPNCHYIGDPKNCACQWTIQRVAAGEGTDPKVVKNAQAILKARENS